MNNSEKIVHYVKFDDKDLEMQKSVWIIAVEHAHQIEGLID